VYVFVLQDDNFTGSARTECDRATKVGLLLCYMWRITSFQGLFEVDMDHNLSVIDFLHQRKGIRGLNTIQITTY
jgi:hypothetical protein